MKHLISTLLTLTFVSLSIAGLDQAGRFDDVVAIYHFENAEDSGPRDFDGLLIENVSIVDNGKIDKCLRLRNDDWFGLLDDHHLAIHCDFSIVAWLKMPSQSEDFSLMMTGRNDDRTIEGLVSLSVLSSGNLEGLAADSKDSKSQIIESENENASDNQWHHIAFTKFSDTAFLFLDGEVVKKQRDTRYLGFVGDGTFISIAPSSTDASLTGSVFIDEVGFFEIGFSVYEIKAIYENGLTDFLEAMPVDPQEKVATTWGKLKSHKH